MKLAWFGLSVSAAFFLLGLISGMLLHRGDVLFLILSGILSASISMVGFDIPPPTRKLGVLLLLMGSLVVAGGVLMAISGHVYVLFIAAAPAFGLVIFGWRQALSAGAKPGNERKSS